MTENNDNNGNKELDPVVVEENDPVVDVNDTSQQGVSGGSVKNKSNLITLVISVFIVVIICYFLFSGNKETDIVDPNSIVRDNKAGGKAVGGTIDDISSIIGTGINYNDQNEYVDSNRELLELPQLPQLPDSISNDIEEEIKEIKKPEKERDENTFTKQEVDELINMKLQSFEKEMNRIRNESEKLAKELERKKIQEEEEKKKKKFSSILNSSPVIPPIDVPIGVSNANKNPTGNNNGNAVNNSGLPPELLGDTEMTLEEQKKQEERELQIAQRARIMEERKSSPMFKMQGGGGGDGTENEQNSIIITNKDSLATVKEEESNVITTKTSDLSRVISQGKIINAILETAIDTDMKTQVRAVVSRDIYSQLGKNILIPKGSRLIGNFQSISNNGVSRLAITWTRIIRVDGLNISISADSADGLGRGGVEGELDNKYGQIMRNAFLSSIVTIATAALVDKVTDTVTTTTVDGTSTSTTTNATNQAIIDATQNIGDEMQDIVDNLKEENPTIRISQGTKIHVIVNQDLTLPIYKQIK